VLWANREPLLVRSGKVAAIEELHRGEVVLERVVDGEHEVVDAQHGVGVKLNNRLLDCRVLHRRRSRAGPYPLHAASGLRVPPPGRYRQGS
jgi:hypothetical protein